MRTTLIFSLRVRQNHVKHVEVNTGCEWEGTTDIAGLFSQQRKHPLGSVAQWYGCLVAPEPPDNVAEILRNYQIS